MLFRDIRLEALRLCPSAFGASFETERQWSDADFARRIPEQPSDAVFGAFGSVNPNALLGILGFRRMTGLKEQHKATLWGMYVRPYARGRGLGYALLRCVIDHATRLPGVEIIQLTVVTDRIEARALYDRAGFLPYGMERRALRLGADEYYDEELRALELPREDGC